MITPKLYDVRAYFDNGTSGTWMQMEHCQARELFDRLSHGGGNVGRPATCIEVRDHGSQHVLYTWLPGLDA